MAGPGERGDTRQTTELEAATVEQDAATAGSVETDTGEHAGDVGVQSRVHARRRTPGLVFPVVVFVALLGAGVVIGRYVVPPPSQGPTPAVRSSNGPHGDATTTPSPNLPTLPTPPARPADALAQWAARVGSVLGVPYVAIQAYGYAQLELTRTDPACHLAWTTIAGVAEVESRHGQAGGAVLEQGGRSSPAIVGPLLDGLEGRPLVRDTDAGAFDGDATFDRAMGPLRLLPSVWRAHAIDADADGILDPYDIDDAALVLGRLLCAGPEDLNLLAGWRAALTHYRPGGSYASSVFKIADDYGQRTRNIV